MTRSTAQAEKACDEVREALDKLLTDWKTMKPRRRIRLELVTRSCARTCRAAGTTTSSPICRAVVVRLGTARRRVCGRSCMRAEHLDPVRRLVPGRANGRHHRGWESPENG